MSNEVKSKLPEKTEHGLSRDEWVWLTNWFTLTNNYLAEQTRYLRNLNTALIIVGVLFVLSVVLRSCGIG
jgi:hypothetical protein